MAWTTPGTAIAGDVLTASFWNSNVRDNLNALYASGANSVGLVLITSTTVSAAATTNFDNVFSSAYQNYLITYAGVTSGTGYVNFGLRVGGSTTGGSGYRHRTAYLSASTLAFLTGASATSAMNVCQGDTTGLSYRINVYRPFDSSPTRCDFYSERDSETQWGGGSHTASTSFDGFAITHDSSQTATGTFRVYGIRNSL